MWLLRLYRFSALFCNVICFYTSLISSIYNIGSLLAHIMYWVLVWLISNPAVFASFTSSSSASFSHNNGYIICICSDLFPAFQDLFPISAAWIVLFSATLKSVVHTLFSMTIASVVPSFVLVLTCEPSMVIFVTLINFTTNSSIFLIFIC